MKAGDLVKLKNLKWDSKHALITSVHRTDWGTGQIYVLFTGNSGSIPWVKRNLYLEVINEVGS